MLKESTARAGHTDTEGMKPPSPQMGFPDSSAGKESACNAGDLRSIPGLGRSPGEGKGYPLYYCGLENSWRSPWGRKESDMTERLSLSQNILRVGTDGGRQQ